MLIEQGLIAYIANVMSVFIRDQVYGKRQGSGFFLLLAVLLTSCVISGNLSDPLFLHLHSGMMILKGKEWQSGEVTYLKHLDECLVYFDHSINGRALKIIVLHTIILWREQQKGIMSQRHS